MTKYAYKLPKGIIDPNDQHFYNIALFYFDRPFKLHDETLKNDMSINETGLCNHLYKWIISIILDFTFWPHFALKSNKWYSAEALVDAICEQSSYSSKNGEAEQNWWQNWIDELPDSTEKEGLQDELILFKFFDKSLYDFKSSGQTLERDLVKFMLFKMGILSRIT
ncbi:MAG: hypothetical protein WB791_07570 [Waddliaceae bacterium]